MNYIIKFSSVGDVIKYLEILGIPISNDDAIKLLGLNIVSRSKLLTESTLFSDICFTKLTPSNYKNLLTFTESKQFILEQLLGLKALSKPSIMGILNVTPDSFSDGSLYYLKLDAVEHADELTQNGAHILDIGGESTRPGAEKVELTEEFDRVVPIVNHIISNREVTISVDTYKSVIAQKSIEAGAKIINDISALQFDEVMIRVLVENPKVKVVIMHMLGTPRTMQSNPVYENVIEDILTFFEERIDFCLKHGITKDRIIIDPGIGFGKRHEDNLNILRYLSTFHSLGCEVLLGASRKSFINRIVESDPMERLPGTLATTSIAYDNAIQYIRVHDVKENKQYLDVLEATKGGV